MKPDILVFMSDQHSPVFSSYQGGLANTPNLEQLCKEGTSFDRAYTSCPLCVPARLSMLTGKLPHKIGILTNKGALSETVTTFLHDLVAEGYETVLIGRMHFIGSNQRHGFTKRLVGDITTTTYNKPSSVNDERGVYKNCFAAGKCTEVIGGGNSPVLEYDKQVIEAAEKYISKKHNKPQCIFVSIYAPHFPYTAPVQLYSKYKKNMEVPKSFIDEYDYLNPILKGRIKNYNDDTVIKARSAYFGMIELVDRYVGHIKQKFDDRLAGNNRQGIFAYISDHGDQVGDRKLFGKRTFFESSARIPMIFTGVNIKANQRINTPVSIMDLFPTLCELAGIKTNRHDIDGVSLFAQLAGKKPKYDRYIISQLVAKHDNQTYFGMMAVRGKYKYISYSGFDEYDILFDIEEDPDERHNLVSKLPKVASEMKVNINKLCNHEEIINSHKQYIESFDLVAKWEIAAGIKPIDRWINTAHDAKEMPLVD